MPRRVLFALVGVPTLMLFLFAVYQLPPVYDRLSWRVEELRAKIKYALNPPEEVVFVPQAALSQVSGLPPTSTALPEPTATLTPEPSQPGPTQTASPYPTITPTPTPLPAKANLTGIRHEYQKWNNCGPANLSMALSYWGWKGDQLETAAYLKPNARDKNVMPYEMADFVNENTNLQAVVRVGGDLEMLKAFIAAGFPVIVEKGFEGESFDGWMGHYEVVSGYDDQKEKFTVQDSYIKPNLLVSYEDLLAQWQAFNYIYIVIYSPERQEEVFSILGPQADEQENFRYAAQRASDEIYNMEGRAQYFAWYDRGSSLVKLQDYSGAAAAYDQAFAVYPSIPQDERPYRMIWYQTGPYYAYFFTQRYYDTIALATTTISASSEPAIEESFYWRARAFYELYLLEGKPEYLAHAEEDYRESLKWHPDFAPTLYQMDVLGMEP